ncbi:MAG: hypothetical protein JXA58_05570 [Dehalococcoidia bacterium]|nr:hypothetical protein [Dehalococcoidia bacterium]
MPKMLPEEAQRLLSNVPEAFTFRCHNGDTYWNLRDLTRAVGSMRDDVFTYHVNENKNDFASWVADVIGDHALARELWETRSPATTTRRLAERLAFLESRRG